MRALGIALVLVLVLVLAGCPRPGTGTGSGTGTATGANAGAWLADLDALVSGLATKHKNLYFKRSRAQLLAKKAQIARALAKRDELLLDVRLVGDELLVHL